MPRRFRERSAWIAGLIAACALVAVPLVMAEDLNGEDPRAKKEARPGALATVLDPINPARFQERLDRIRDAEEGNISDRPRAPEIGEPVFFDNVRPLGDLKYANELNYLFNSSSRNAPTLQVIEYEYTFADWRATEIDLAYFNGSLEILTPFYQRTLGVGPRGNWVHGYQLSADIYTRSGFVGGSPAYMFGWKPEAESHFSSLFFAGANRALIGGFDPRRSIATGPPRLPGDEVFGAWRPLFNANLFYKLSERLTFGVENDLFFGRGKAAEYLVLPFLTIEPSERLFVQVGGGYYHFESRDQFTFFAHINLVNPSKRKPKVREEPRTGQAEEGGPIRRLMGSFRR